LCYWDRTGPTKIQAWCTYVVKRKCKGEANVKAVGPNCAKLHAYVMEYSKDKLPFAAKVDQDYFKGGCGALMLNIEFSSVYNLITLVSLDVTFMRLWTL
jgi:hypothetical protein